MKGMKKRLNGEQVLEILLQNNIPRQMANILAIDGLLFKFPGSDKVFTDMDRLSDTVARICGYASYKQMQGEFFKEQLRRVPFGCEGANIAYDIILPQKTVYDTFFEKCSPIPGGASYLSELHRTNIDWLPGMFSYLFDMIEKYAIYTVLKEIKDSLWLPPHTPYVVEHHFLKVLILYVSRLAQLDSTARRYHLGRLEREMSVFPTYMYMVRLCVERELSGQGIGSIAVPFTSFLVNRNPHTHGIILFPVTYGYDKDKSYENYEALKNEIKNYVIGDSVSHPFVGECCNIMLRPMPDTGDFAFCRTYIVDYLYKLTPEELLNNPNITGYADFVCSFEKFIKGLAEKLGHENIMLYEVQCENSHGRKNYTIKKYPYGKPQEYQTLSYNELVDMIDERIESYRAKATQTGQLLCMKPVFDAHTFYRLAELECEFKLIYNMVLTRCYMDSI